MNKKLLLFSIALVLIVSINAVSGYYFYPKYQTDDFKEITEFKKITEQRTGDFWNFESTKRIVIERTEVRKRTRTPIYYSYPNYYGNFYYGNSYAPFSSRGFKGPYSNRNYINARYSGYNYNPRYDYNLGYSNYNPRYDYNLGYYNYKPRYDYNLGYYNRRW